MKLMGLAARSWVTTGCGVQHGGQDVSPLWRQEAGHLQDVEFKTVGMKPIAIGGRRLADHRMWSSKQWARCLTAIGGKKLGCHMTWSSKRKDE